MTACVDLHTHSTASDGTDAPAAVVARAAALGLCAVALTDHDTLAGLEEAADAGMRLGVELVRGCELAVASPYGEVHLLGLWLPRHAPRLEAALAAIRVGREARNREMVERFRQAGHEVTYAELQAEAGGDLLSRAHMARLLLKKGICASRAEVFSRFLGDGRPMHVPRAIPTPEEGLALLRTEGAVTVFAHPMLLKAPLDKLEMLVRDMADMGLDAIEAYHSDHNAKAVRRAESFARRYGLAISGGSDYHGSMYTGRELGRGNGNLYVPRAILEGLRARKPAIAQSARGETSTQGG